MKYLALAMLLAVVQASRPVPRQACDTSTGRGQAVQKNAAAYQQPPNATLPVEKSDRSQTNKTPSSAPSLRAVERQAKANEGQLTEIQQSAEKTDRMILLAAQQAEHGRISAQAAKASADALKGIERALIIVTLEASARTPTGGSTAIQIQGAEQSTAAVTIICQNEGKSPAWLIDVWARFEVVD